MNCHDIAGRLAGDQGLDMRGPQIESARFLRAVQTSIVNTGDASLGAGLVIEHGFNNVRLDADVGHARCTSATKIMQPPRHRCGSGALLDPPVEPQLGLAVSAKAVAGGTVTKKRG